ncbi:MAG: hypothetical protein KAS67_01585 [Thermoplasmata archaeon]|nr:hypothetical protein [Thermoplasmata archaeon]
MMEEMKNDIITKNMIKFMFSFRVIFIFVCLSILIYIFIEDIPIEGFSPFNIFLLFFLVFIIGNILFKIYKDISLFKMQSQNILASTNIPFRERFVGLHGTKPWEAAILIGLVIVLLIFSVLSILKGLNEMSDTNFLMSISMSILDFFFLGLSVFALYLFIPFLRKPG